MTEEIKEKPTEGKKRFKLNIWMASTIFLIIILIVVLIVFGTGISGMAVTSSDNTLKPEEAALKTIKFINENLVQPGTEASFVSVGDFEGLYNVTISYQDRDIPVFVTKDGSFIFLSAPLDITQELPKLEEETQEQQQPEGTSINENELINFIECLKNSDFKIYGANWCGWTQRLVTMLGGFDMVEPIYIECTEQKEECEKAGITGFPTIIIKEQRYQGERTFKAFSDATGCAVPTGAETEQNNPAPSGGCQ